MAGSGSVVATGEALGPLFAELLEHSPEAVLLSTDRLGQVTFLNASTAAAVGREAPGRAGAPPIFLAELLTVADARGLNALLAGPSGRSGPRLVNLVDQAGNPFTVRATIEVMPAGLVLAGFRMYGGDTAVVSELVRVNNQLATMARESARKERDLTRAVAELAETTAYNRSLFEASVDPLTMISPEGRVSDVNEAAIRLTGALREQLIGTRFSDFFTDPEKAWACLLEVLNEGTIRNRELLLRHPDGRDVPVEVNATVLRNNTGAIREVLASARDMTERRAADETIRESERRYRLLVDSALESIVVLQDGLVRQCNPATPVLTGYSAEELLSIPFPQFLHPDDRPALLDNHQRRLRGEIFSSQFEFRYLRKDGSTRWAHMNVAPIEWNGRPATLNFMMDITERKEREEEILRHKEGLENEVVVRTTELREANRELEAFAYSVSHELRTPLRAIDGHSAIIARDFGAMLDEKARRHFGQVRWNAQRMGRLVDDLLAFSRAGRTDLAFGPVDMAGAARAAFGQVSTDPEACSRVSFSMGELPGARGDAALLQRVWLNLLSNAVKFTAGRERPEIRLEGRVEGEEAVYQVRDNGVGFDMRYVDKLFGVFQRLHGIHEFEGTGVGLALVRRIVNRHGGRVWAEGELGRGATFSFSLPSRDAGVKPG